MADPPATASDVLPRETPAQAKARLRRERLAAKSGAARLQQITALQGGPPKDIGDFSKDVPVKPSSIQSQQARVGSGTATPDPEEVDISQHHYANAPQPRLPSSFASDGNPSDPFGPGPGPNQQSDPSQDPIMLMLQQMMGGGANGMPGGPGQAGAGPNDLPPGLANLFSAMNGGAAAEPSPEQSPAWIWRLVHSVFSLGLAVYIVLQTPFTGSRLSRQSFLNDDWTAPSAPSAPAANFFHFFNIFATFEVVLQSSRYFIEKGQLQRSGILSTVAGILPAPYAGYVRTIGRYSVIYSTVVNDAMVIVFVLGATSWWRGAAVA